MVQFRQRSSGGAVASRVFRRSLRRLGNASQPAASPAACDRGRGRAAGRDRRWLVDDRSQASCDRTDVRAASRRSRHAGAARGAARDERVMNSRAERGRPSLFIRLIDGYQRAFEGRPSPCRFTPSCSTYARDAFELHGRWRGAWLTIRRLVRCRPFGPSGFDPVPLTGEPSHPHRHGHATDVAAAPCCASPYRASPNIEGPMSQ